MFDVVVLSAELVLTVIIYFSVKQINERVEKIEKSLHREKIQVRVLKSKNGN